MTPYEVLRVDIFLYEWGGFLRICYLLLLLNAFRYSFRLPVPSQHWSGAWPVLFFLTLYIRTFDTRSAYESDPFEEDYEPYDFFEAFDEDVREVVVVFAGLIL